VGAGLTADSLLDLLARFIHLEVIEAEIGGKKVCNENMILPRYHQRDAVRKIGVRAREEGAGNNYLVMRSAGSGKSTSIAWLAHRLCSHTSERRQTAPHQSPSGAFCSSDYSQKCAILSSLAMRYQSYHHRM
jgi:hypothetical protein